MFASILIAVTILLITYFTIAYTVIKSSDTVSGPEDGGRQERLQAIDDYYRRTREHDLQMYELMEKMEEQRKRIAKIKKPKLKGSGLGFSNGRRQRKRC